MNVGSLFSGVGGIELGFEREGFTTSWFVENDAYCQAVLRKHWQNTPIYGDITKIDFSTLPRVDVLTGGFPCQDISNAGKRIGISGSRSSLWKYYCEAIRTIRPKFAVIENVAALANRGLNVVLADLAKIGYDAEWYNLSASSVGAPHRRERLFIIAYPCIERCDNWSNNRERRHVLSDKGIASEGEQERERWEHRTGTIGEDVSNACIQGLDGQWQPERIQKAHSDNSQLGWWNSEPRICRVAHGIPNRVDRIKCLGNAVVPAVAQTIAKTIKY